MTSPVDQEQHKKKPSTTFDEIYTADYAKMAERILEGEVTEQGSSPLTAVLKSPEGLKGIEVFTEEEVNQQISDFLGQFDELQRKIFKSHNGFALEDLVTEYDDEKQSFLIRKKSGEHINKIYFQSLSLTDLYMPLAFLELEDFMLGDNYLATIPTLPNSVLRLFCSGNVITHFSTLPPFLERLDCSMNKITALPKLPATLKHLACASNELTSLPDLPEGLEVLWCQSNMLTTLPYLPSSLRKVHVFGFSPLEKNNPLDEQTLDILKQRGFLQ